MSTAYSHVIATLWAWWFCLSMAFFMGLEFTMLAIGRPQDTLSANIWRWEGFLPGQSVWHWTAVHFLFIAALFVLNIWLIGHFGWRIWA